jgi:hypothetical protein
MEIPLFFKRRPLIVGSGSHKSPFGKNKLRMGKTSSMIKTTLIVFLTISVLGIVQCTVAESEWRTYELIVNEQTLNIPYRIVNGKVNGVEVDSELVSMIISISDANKGVLEIALPRQILDPKYWRDGVVVEDGFVVFDGGEETGYVEIKNTPCFRTISVEFSATTEEIEVIGTRDSLPPTEVLPVYVATEKKNYDVGEVLTISGCTNLALQDKEVVLEVLNPEGKIYQTLSVIPNIDGSFSASLPLEGELAINGSYTVKATYAGYTYVPEFPIAMIIISVTMATTLLVLRTKKMITS